MSIATKGNHTVRRQPPPETEVMAQTRNKPETTAATTTATTTTITTIERLTTAKHTLKSNTTRLSPAAAQTNLAPQQRRDTGCLSFTGFLPLRVFTLHWRMVESSAADHTLSPTTVSAHTGEVCAESSRIIVMRSADHTNSFPLERPTHTYNKHTHTWGNNSQWTEKRVRLLVRKRETTTNHRKHTHRHRHQRKTTNHYHQPHTCLHIHIHNTHTTLSLIHPHPQHTPTHTPTPTTHTVYLLNSTAPGIGFHIAEGVDRCIVLRVSERT
jgi:hypothetical protein